MRELCPPGGGGVAVQELLRFNKAANLLQGSAAIQEAYGSLVQADHMQQSAQPGRNFQMCQFSNDCHHMDHHDSRSGGRRLPHI